MEEQLAAISMTNVSFNYGERAVLQEIDLQVNSGDFLGIVGPNGSGKSTLLKIMLGLLEPDAGDVRLFGVPIKAFKDWHRIGYISQKANSFNSGFPATVAEVVQMGLTARRGLFKRVTPADKLAVKQALQAVGMTDYSNQLIGKLSGGQQQRVFIAKALVANPDLLLLDEPTVGVDATSMADFYELLEKIHRHQHKTLVMVTHDIGAITTRVNRIACLNRRIYFHGASEQFVANQEQILSRAYQHPVQHLQHGHTTNGDCHCGGEHK